MPARFLILQPAPARVARRNPGSTAMKKFLIPAAIVIVLAGAFGVWFFRYRAVDDELVKQVKSTITTELKAKGYGVKEIDLIRADDTSMTGVAKLVKDKADVMVTCNVTLNPDRTITWQCN